MMTGLAATATVGTGAVLLANQANPGDPRTPNYALMAGPGSSGMAAGPLQMQMPMMGPTSSFDQHGALPYAPPSQYQTFM